MNKEFIPYEQALALKELGFDEPCFAKYTFIPEDEINWFTIPEQGITNKTTFGSSKNYNSKSFEEEGTISAPTYSQAFRWFREKYEYIPHVFRNSTSGKYSWKIDDRYSYVDYTADIFNTYEEAELECLIKLIEIVKTK